MRHLDYKSLDWRALNVLITVLDEGSVTAAANRLGIAQSAVSHTLDKLRSALGDPLFVRSGRGILPTERAKTLRAPIQSILDDLKALTTERAFDPKLEPMEFTVSANDFQREILFPSLMREFEEQEIDVRFRFLQGGVPTANLLQDAYCDLIVTPLPPNGSGIMQTSLFTDTIVCFFDAEMREAPANKAEFLACEFAEVRFPNYSSALAVLTTVTSYDLKQPKVTVPNFSDLAAFMRGTKLITTQMSAMRAGPLSEFCYAPLPFENDTLTMHLAWHQRDNADPAHQWLRAKVKERADDVAANLFADHV